MTGAFATLLSLLQFPQNFSVSSVSAEASLPAIILLSLLGKNQVFLMMKKLPLLSCLLLPVFSQAWLSLPCQSIQLGIARYVWLQKEKDSIDIYLDLIVWNECIF